MTLNYNKKLSKLAINSSLAQSAIPVIVCDEQLLICMISYGARKLCFPMQLGKNMAGLFDENTLVQLSTETSGALVTQLVRGHDTSTAIIVSDEINGERYRAIVILPQIMFSHAKAPWYIGAAFDSLRASLKELISSERADVERLDLCCMHLSTLFSFLQEPSASVLSSKYASPGIYKQLDTVVGECAKVFRSIGGTVTADCVDDVSFTTLIHPRHINILSTTLLSLLILSSNDANVHICSEIKKGKNGSMTISHSINTELVKASPIDTIDELRHRLIYLAPELAAIQDLASRLDVSLSCKTESSRLTVTYSIPICTGGAVVFHETDVETPKRVANLASALIREFVLDGRRLSSEA